VVADERVGAAIELAQLRQGAAQVDALSDVNLAVEAGELVAVMGPSGRARHTADHRGHLEEASSGEVLIDGVAVSSLSADERARRCGVSTSATCSKISTSSQV
jgi:predicted ABC-type transport system involved in lysophospholipase L1 biosynthesis ATPase subunit